LAYALALTAGSENELARLLMVTVPQLTNWLNGVDAIPDRVFLGAVDIVVQSSPEAIARSREVLAKFKLYKVG
jgi:transcriptional regulator with XRE-family HTH domain